MSGGRRLPRRPVATGGASPCSYAAGQIGELAAIINGLLSSTASSGTAFDIEPQGAAIYVHGRPAANNPSVRQLERDTAAMTGNDPYTGVNGEKIVNCSVLAHVEERVLHMQTADPLRTPTYTIFPKPDYFFGTSGANVAINSGFAYNHGYYSPNIDVTWAAIAGPGVAVRVDGPRNRRPPATSRTIPTAQHRATGEHRRNVG